MKKKDFQEYKNKSVVQLKKAVADLEKEITDIKLEQNPDKVKNVHIKSGKRKDIARIMTILHTKHLQESQPKEAKDVAK